MGNEWVDVEYPWVYRASVATLTCSQCCLKSGSALPHPEKASGLRGPDFLTHSERRALKNTSRVPLDKETDEISILRRKEKNPNTYWGTREGRCEQSRVSSSAHRNLCDPRHRQGHKDASIDPSVRRYGAEDSAPRTPTTATVEQESH